MNVDYVSIGRNPPEEVNAIIEVPIGGEPIKYQMDKKSGTLVVDRFLYTPMRYPGNYGFIPHTLSEDGDPCDVLVANTRPIIPGAVIAVRPIGVLKMTDEGAVTRIFPRDCYLASIKIWGERACLEMNMATEAGDRFRPATYSVSRLKSVRSRP
jgi:hypothetical protein